MAIIPVLVTLAVVFSGYVVFIPDFNGLFRQAGVYTSIFRFPFQTLVLNEFNNNDNLPRGHDYITRLGFRGYDVDSAGSISIVIMAILSLFYLAALKYIRYETN
jgi:ABC-type branched-subunit amino acid transport system permease subunit